MADMDATTRKILQRELEVIEEAFGLNLVLVWQTDDAFGVVSRSCPICTAELLYRTADQLAVDGGSCGKHATRRKEH